MKKSTAYRILGMIWFVIAMIVILFMLESCQSGDELPELPKTDGDAVIYIDEHV